MAKLAIMGGAPVARLRAPEWPIYSAEDRKRLVEVLESCSWSWMGAMETAFNQAWAEFNGSKYSLLVTNGTHALQLAYEALDIGWGDEVVVPGLTWQATAAAVLDVNAVPVLVDIEPDTWTIAPHAVEAAITPRTKAIVAVHLYGRMADMDALCDISSRHGIPLVEDAAHQHGSQWRGKSAGVIGTVGTFSFQQSKAMTCGEGGSILVQDEELFGRLDQLRNCGRLSPHLPVDRQGPLQSGNYRASEWQAAILLGQLERLPEHLQKREASARRLDDLLAEVSGVLPLRQRDQPTRQGYYAYGFRFLPEEWEGVSRTHFCRALGAETGLNFGAVYESLSKCCLYLPATKPRHCLSKSYLQAIDPQRRALPVTERIASCEGVITPHTTLLLDPREMEKIADAIGKIYVNRDELRRLQTAEKAPAGT